MSRRFAGTVLVTGARGFVGRHLVAALRHSCPEATVVEASFDVTRPAEIREELARLRPAACIHLAAISAIPAARADPERAWHVNLLGTLSLAETIRDASPACRLIYASTGEVYGQSFAAGLPLDEHAVLAPMNAYAATKAAADLALGAMALDGLDAVRLRLFNHTGPGQSDAFVVAAFARQIARIEAGLQEPALRVGNLEPRRDFLDVADVCAAYLACLNRAAAVPSGSILNIASGTPRRIGDVLDMLMANSGARLRVEVESARLRGREIEVAVGNPEKAQRLLDWRPACAFDATLARVMADWRLRVRAGE